MGFSFSPRRADIIPSLQAHTELSGEEGETNVRALMDADRTSRCRLSLVSPLRCADKATEPTHSTLLLLKSGELLFFLSLLFPFFYLPLPAKSLQV